MPFQWILKSGSTHKNFLLRAAKAYIVLLSLIFTNKAVSQDFQIADSLVDVLQKGELNTEDLLEVLRNIAHNHNNPDSVLFYADKLLELASEHSDLHYLHRGFFQKGQAYRLKGNFSESLKFFFKSVEAAKEAGYLSGEGNAYVSLGDVYSLNDDHSNSIYYYELGIKLLRGQNDSVFLASALLNAGDEYYKVNNLDLATLYFTESKLIYEKLNYTSGIGYSLGNLGLVYAAQKDYDLAEQYLKNAILILENLSDKYSIAAYLVYLSQVSHEKHDLKNSLQYAKKSLDIANDEGFKEQIRDASLKLSELYNQQNDFEKAYHFQSQYIAYRDSINNEETTRQMADLRTEYEVAQKQGEIDLLTATKAKQKIIALSLGFGVLLIGVLAYVQYRNHRREIAINKELSAQKTVLHKQRDQLEALNNTKDRFFSIISHDLRGPVNAFNGISSLIQHYISINDLEQLVEVSQYIDKSASQLSSLLDNLLNWAVNQQGSFPYLPEKIHFCEMMDEVVEIFQTTAHSKNIRLKIDCEKELMVWADRNSLTTIIRNLVNNALKFTNPNGTVTISAYAKGSWSIIKVIDTGVGIAPEKLKSIFKLIAKKNSSGTAGEKGLGLGLQLAYDFSLLNKGSIKVESKEDVGTTFILKIPRHNEQLASVGSEVKAAESVS